ncbi:hypothetical protein ANN_06645, partial [Periplaneta americana]
YVNAANSSINVFYSTPSCYLKAVHDARKTWTTKLDDFFPYASDPHTYWSGYFTSRPTLKRFERLGNNYLQDSDTDIHVEECFLGRKSRCKESQPKRKICKTKEEPQINYSHGLQKLATNTKGKKNCKAAELCYNDIITFHHHVASLNKTDQDKFLLKFMEICTPKRRIVATENAKRKKRVSVKYTIRKKNGTLLPVCAATFQAVSGMSKDRLSYLANRFHEMGKVPKEMRGGNRAGEKHKELTLAIKNDIKSYKCRESHHGRGKSKRGCLPSHLSVNKMWKFFCANRNASGLNLCSLSKYKRIFYKCFNLSFKTSHTDTCSTCKMNLLKIKAEQDLEKKNELRTNYRLHKLRAKQFYKIMKDDNADIIKICFDMQKNQPLPKLSVSEVFYSRQIWLYNLCIMIHSEKQRKEDITFYTWLETESTRGCNQVASALLDFMCDLENKVKNGGASTIHLFSDSCSSQNKNSVMMATLTAFLERSKKFSNIIHFFPVRGHSYMAPDRVFGRIEKSYRRQETITSPKEYYDLLEEHGTLKVLNKDWNVRNLKESSKKVLRSKLPFKMNSQRLIMYKKNLDKVEISVTSTYFGDLVQVEVLKNKSCHQIMLNSTVLPKKSAVSKEKKNDVAKNKKKNNVQIKFNLD